MNSNNNFQEYNHNYINYIHSTNNSNIITQNSNETMIRQKYESISESMVPHKYIQNTLGDYAATEDNTVDKYLNFGDENNDHLGVKQEELECEYIHQNQLNNDQYLSLCYDTAGISFITPDQTSNNRNHSTSYSSSSATAATSSHMSIKMKRIMKREKAKSRTTFQQYQQIQPQQRQQQPYEVQDIQFRQRNESAASNTTSSSSTTIPIEVKVESNSTIYMSSPSRNEDMQLKVLQQQCASGLLDPKQQKKVMQMIRNRISAQNSRDRKKAYITQLESAKDEFQLETIELRQALNLAQAELNQEKNKNQLLFREINELKNKLCPSAAAQLKISESQQNALSINGTYQNQDDNTMSDFVVPGVVVIFNSKQSDPLISSNYHHLNNNEMSKKSQDLRNVSAQSEQISFQHMRLHNLQHKELQTIEISDEVIQPSNLQENNIDNPTVIEDDSHLYLKHQDSDQIKKDQWIQFVVPKPNHGNSQNRDDLSRDSAETDDMSNSGQSQKYIQVWAQIKSVNEFEQEN